MTRFIRRGLAVTTLGLAALATDASAGGWSFSIGVGFGWGGGRGGGWVGPFVGVGSSWYGGYGGGGGGWYAPYHGGYCDSGYYGGYHCSSYVAPRHWAPAYGSGAYYADTRQTSNSSYSSAAQAASVRMAASPRPVAPQVPAETSVARGCRLMEAGEPGAMEAFGRAVARSEGADAYLGYAICAANAGQNQRAEWAARTALRKDAKVLAKAPAGAGVKGAADAALTKFAGSTPGANEGRWFTVAVLSTLSGDAEGAATASARLAGVDEAADNLRAAVGGASLIAANNQVTSEALPKAELPERPGASASRTTAPVATLTPARRVVVAVEPEAK